MGHGIVPDSAGWGTFTWALVVFLIATMIFALNLQIIIRNSRRLGAATEPIFRIRGENVLSGQVAEASRTASNLFRTRYRARSGGPRQNDVEEGTVWFRLLHLHVVSLSDQFPRL